ncbi:hypothetical protein V1511DRAFT_512232 [Dipodascopsis uninucleata]
MSFDSMLSFGRQQADEMYGNYYQPEQHEAKFSHEAVAGAASFMAMKVFEDRQRREGAPVKHQFAKEVIAGIAGAEVDKLVETKGLNFIDTERAKHHARQQVEQMYDEHYGQMDSEYFVPENHPPPPQMMGFQGGYEQRDFQEGGYGAGYGGDYSSEYQQQRSDYTVNNNYY